MCATGPNAGVCTRVLFVGNSYTYVNDLPSTFAQLARSGGHAVDVGSVANGAETLAQHVESSDDATQLAAEPWSYVVLQEQSDTPAYSSAGSLMYGPVHTLSAAAFKVGAMPMLFMTWAHKDGESGAGLPSYEAAQARIESTYLELSGQLRLPVAPVGDAWLHVHADHPDMALWRDDNSHPTALGTYLAACVFYAAIFRESPAGLSYRGGASGDDAALLQGYAGRTVLDSQTKWGLH